MMRSQLIKLVNVCTASALCIISLAGCDSGVESDNVDVIKIWSGESHSQDAYDELINEWNETEGVKKGIKIDYQVQGGDTITQNVELALQNGDAPDMFEVSDIKKYSELGYISALDDLPGGQDLLDKYEDIIREGVNSYHGKTYTVPRAAETRGLIYNKEMFIEAGIVDENGEAKPPETYEEMREAAKKLTDKANNKYGIILPMKWSGWFNSDVLTPLYASTGHSGYNTAEGVYDYSKLVDIMQYFLDMKEDGSIYPAPESLDNDTARAYFAEGMIGMKYAYSFDAGVLNDQFPAKMEWGVAPFPVLDANEKYNQKMTQTNTFAINSKSAENEDKAKEMIEVLKFFTSDKFVGELYKRGLQLPCDMSIVDDIELGDDAPQGWRDFADMISISEFAQKVPDKIMDGKATLKDRFVNDVWNGAMTPAQMIEEYTADVTEATEIWYNENTDEKREDYISRNTHKRQ